MQSLLIVSNQYAAVFRQMLHLAADIMLSISVNMLGGGGRRAEGSTIWERDQ